MAATPTNHVMVTTTDNPFSPFTQFDEWFRFDEAQGYHTCQYLARVTRTSDELSFSDQELAIEQAIDSIVELNVLGIYTKVSHSSEQNSENV